jgi:hypothetical protein
MAENNEALSPEEPPETLELKPMERRRIARMMLRLFYENGDVLLPDLVHQQIWRLDNAITAAKVYREKRASRDSA